MTSGALTWNWVNISPRSSIRPDTYLGMSCETLISQTHTFIQRKYHPLKLEWMPQEEVNKEAQTCLSDAKRRLENAVQELDELLKVEEENLTDAPDLEEAKSLLQQYESKDDDA
jgi:hypothetical protein